MSEARMKTPNFYALVVINDNGQEEFAGAFREPELAERKGRDLGKQFSVRPAFLD
jgi:hypothetical protein